MDPRCAPFGVAAVTRAAWGWSLTFAALFWGSLFSVLTILGVL